MWYIPKIVVLCTKLFNMHIAPFLLWKEIEYQIWSSQACKGFMLPLPCSWCYEWYHIVFLYWICIECMSSEPLWKMYLHGNKHFLNLNLNLNLNLIMACHLLDAEPLSETMLACSRLDPWELISVDFESQCNNFHSIKWMWKCCLKKGSHSVLASMCSECHKVAYRAY